VDKSGTLGSWLSGGCDDGSGRDRSPAWLQQQTAIARFNTGVRISGQGQAQRIDRLALEVSQAVILGA
jgi:hypothetical protein